MAILPVGKTTKMNYSEGTPAKVIFLLEKCLHRHDLRVRLFYGDKETGTYWGDEWGVTGTIGRSTGEPIPLLIANSRSFGGAAILTDCIVRMLINGEEVYRHPTYNSPYEDAIIQTTTEPGYTHEVVSTRGVEARHRSYLAANRWLQFMCGERMGK